MIEPPKEGFWLLVMYALAAISGGLGGCASWAWYSSRNNRNKRRAVYLAAYIIIGAVFGMVSVSMAMIYNVWIHSVQEIILYGILSGGAGTIAIFMVNLGAGVILRWRGIELRLTFRDNKQERRSDDHDDI